VNRAQLKDSPVPRRSLVIPILAIVALLFTAMPAAARSQIAIGISDPRGSDLAVLQKHMAMTGAQKPALWSLWSNWGSRGGRVVCRSGVGNCAFPIETAKELLRRGITPVIWWQPIDPAHPARPTYTSYKRIIYGKHDTYIRDWARDLKRASKANGGRPVVVRFAHEATGHWFPWSIGRHGNTVRNYKKAWRHIDKLFRQVGARKYTRFLWSNFLPKSKSYPGDKIVDYVGATIMNYGSTSVEGKNSWSALPNRVHRVVLLARKFTNKPLFLAEVGSSHKGGDKARWIRNGYHKTFERYPKVKAIMYLDTDEPHRAVSHPDWRLIKPLDGSAVRAYRAVANSWRFKGRVK
jgi:mannan endo-1,4-beta-mannosidase